MLSLIMIFDSVSYQQRNNENVVNHYCYHVHDTSKNLKYDYKIHSYVIRHLKNTNPKNNLTTKYKFHLSCVFF
jgi:hypothetical protein